MESRLPGRHGATYISAASGYHSQTELAQGSLLPHPAGCSLHNATRR
jgi:hypothetical protein